MAGIVSIAQTAEISTGTSAKTLVQVVSASDHQIELLEAQVSFDGISSTAEPIICELVRQSDAGTMSGLTPVLAHSMPASFSIRTTAQHTASSEPTTGDVLWREEVHPQSKFIWRPSGPLRITAWDGGRLAIRVTAPASVNATARLVVEE